jgi:hypothetical protein
MSSAPSNPPLSATSAKFATRVGGHAASADGAPAGKALVGGAAEGDKPPEEATDGSM